MKKVLPIVAAAGAAALLGASPASAAPVKGVVVSNDKERGTVVTVDRKGAATTLRVKRAGSYKAGQRVRANATKLADGTYSTKRVKRQGRAGNAKLRATLIDRQGRNYVVSAGSSTFLVPAARRAGASAAAAAPQPGDVIAAQLRLAKGDFAAQDVDRVGEAALVELEGIFLEAADGKLELAVSKRGRVSVTVPDGTQIAATAGDEVELLVSVGEDGFTLVALSSEDDEGGFDFDESEAEIEGVISAIAPGTITVEAGPGASITCVLPAHIDLSAFSIGDAVEMACEVVDGEFQVRELESESSSLEVDEDGEHELEVEDDQNDED